MNRNEFYKLAESLRPRGQLSSNDSLLNSAQTRWLRVAVGYVRALRETYPEDSLIKDVTTNIGATLILIESP